MFDRTTQETYLTAEQFPTATTSTAPPPRSSKKYTHLLEELTSIRQPNAVYSKIVLSTKCIF